MIICKCQVPTGRRITQDIYMTDEYVFFANRLFDIWYAQDNPNLHIILFEEMIRSLLGKGSKICQIGSGICASMTLSFYPDGTIRPCDKFPRTNESADGNVLVNIANIESIDEVLSEINYKKLVANQTETLSLCKKCKWFKSCRGACAFDRHMFKKEAIAYFKMFYILYL